MVTSWLYCSGERNCSSGRASSPRISSAITPPAKNQANAVAVYIRPMVLWSVVRSSARNRDPFSGRGAAEGRLMIGVGAIVIASPER
jgi:hypothetical protein